MLVLILAFLRPALDFGGVLGGITDIVGSTKIHGPNYYTPTGAPQADQAFLQALQAISQATDRNTGMVDPVLLHSYSQMLGIDLSGLISAGGQAGDQYKQLATQAGQFGQAERGMGQQIQQTAFDPQNQLHDFLQQQTTDQSRAADSARGLASSPYSSGNESTALRNFNLDWQNRQLGRQVQGAQGATGAFDASMGYGSAQPGFTMAGAQAPIAGQTAAYGAPQQFSTQFLGAENAMFAPQAGLAGMAQNYLTPATNAASNQYNQDMNATMAKYQMMSGGFNSIFGGGAGDPSQWFGFQGGNPFSQGNWGAGGGGAGGAGGGMGVDQILSGGGAMGAVPPVW